MTATVQLVADPFMPRKLSKIGAMEALGNYPSAHGRDQAEVAKCLLADASFFQRADVATRITLVGLSVAADRLSSILPSSSTGSRAVEVRRLCRRHLGRLFGDDLAILSCLSWYNTAAKLTLY